MFLTVRNLIVSTYIEFGTFQGIETYSLICNS